MYWNHASEFQETFFPQLLSFITLGILSSIIIHKSSKAGLIEEYKKKEKQYLEHLILLQKDYKKALADVKARDEFLSIVSHELKTPLTSMLLKLQTALHNIRNTSLANFSVENLLKMLESAEQQSKRLSKMITDLLNVSLMTTGKIDLDPEKMDLSQAAKDVIERFKEKLEKEGYRLTISAEKPVVGSWDKLRVEQAISNLVGNAIKYGRGNPISVTVANSNGTGKFIIEDNGIGIPKTLQEKIFTRFGRAVETHEYEGLGVGLYITKQIVHAHQGELHVRSREGSGSTFTIELPIN
jgi:signal transduction histidine kinase